MASEPAKNTMERLLIIDDDISLNELLDSYLSDFGFSVKTMSDPVAAVRHLNEDSVDLVVLDVMMPVMDGFEVLRKIRERLSVPVIMLTARGDVTDRIVGLELGADDYLPKPFEPRELVARIRSVLKRFNGESGAGGEILKTPGGIELEPDRREVRLDGDPLDLTTMEFDLLDLMIRKRGRVLSRDYLMECLKGYEWEAYDRSIDVAVSRLRHKLTDDPATPKFIKTIRGVGYMFVG